MENIYSAPQAELENRDDVITNDFYQVSSKKFALLFFGTLGMYPIYWFYRHWQAQSEANNEPLSAVWRAIFSVFFVHSLFARIDQKVFGKTEFRWQGSALATAYVATWIASLFADWVINELFGTNFTGLSFYVFLIIDYFILSKAQVAANVACGDPDGRSNSIITPANIFWIVIGGVLWFINISNLLFFYGILDQPMGYFMGW